MSTIGVAIIGSGGIALANHLPGFALCPDTKVVALCDSNPETLARASQQTGIKATSTNWEDIVKRDDVHAIVIATPNYVHAPITIAAAKAGKHVLCEKPIALSYPEARSIPSASGRFMATGFSHSTCFLRAIAACAMGA